MKIRTLRERLNAMSDIIAQLKKDKEKSLSDIKAMDSKLKAFMSEIKVITSLLSVELLIYKIYKPCEY